MPYNYTPQFYQQMSYGQPTAQQSLNVIWVQGENAAKAYPIMAGQSAILMDSENAVFYIKSTDQSGMPLPLRIFDYTERSNGVQQETKVEKPEYVTKEEFDKLKEEIKRIRRRAEEPVKENKNA